MEKRKARRDPALDVLRCVALFCVVGIHFFVNNEFYDQPVAGIRMYIMVLMRTAFSICVPLFLLLSGYLLCNKKPVRSYYGKLTKTLAIYVMVCVCCIIYRLIYAAVTKAGTVSIPGQITKIFSFTCSPYCWYIEMYIGLFLLAPFLNILYRNLDGKKQKQLLLLTLLLLTALPDVVNIFRFSGPQWWLSPSTSTDYHHLLPDWWLSLYPVTYYFIGCYLREYPLKLKPGATGLLFALVCVAVGSFTYYRSDGQVFADGIWLNWGSLVCVVLAVLTFHFFLSLNYEKPGSRAAGIFALISELSLGAFMLSWIFDRVFYRLLNAWVPVMQKRLEYFPLVVGAVLICSLALSAVLNFIYNLAARAISKRRSARLPAADPCDKGA